MNLGSRTESKFSHFDEENGISSPKLVLFFLHFFPIMYLRARFRKKDEEDNLAKREQDVLFRRLQLFTHLRQDLERVMIDTDTL